MTYISSRTQNPILLMVVIAILLLGGCTNSSKKTEESSSSDTSSDTAAKPGPAEGTSPLAKIKDPYLRHAMAVMNSDDYEAAIEAFDMAAEHGNKSPELYLARAICFRNVGKPRSALLDFDKVADSESPSVTPEYRASAYDGISDSHIRLHQYQEALESAEDSLKVQPGSVAQANKAESLFRLGRYRESIAPFEIAMKDWENLSAADDNEARSVRSRLAEAYDILGEKAKARRELDFLLSPDPNTPNEKKIAAANAKKSAELEKTLKRTLKTSRLIVHTNLENVEYQINFCERFLNHVDKTMVPLQPNFKVHVYILRDEDDFKEFMKKNLNSNENVYGIFDSRYNSIFTYAESGLGTYAYELMNKVVFDRFPWEEPWAADGIPALFEKIYCVADGSFNRCEYGFHNPWRIEAMDDSELKAIDLKQCIQYRVKVSGGNESADRLIAMFLLREGKLNRYLDLACQGKIGKFGSIFENALGKTIDEITPKWKGYLSSVASRRKSIDEIPSSFSFDKKAEFDAFMAKYKKTLANGW